MNCLYCDRGQHNECLNGNCKCADTGHFSGFYYEPEDEPPLKPSVEDNDSIDDLKYDNH